VTATASTFRLVSACGDTLGSIESSEQHWQPGDELHANGLGYRVTAVISLERLAEFVDEPGNGLLEVEPL
jgi:hypothetical protein